MYEEHWLGAKLTTSADKNGNSLKSKTLQSRTPNPAVWKLTAPSLSSSSFFLCLILHCFGPGHSGRDDKGFKPLTLLDSVGSHVRSLQGDLAWLFGDSDSSSPVISQKRAAGAAVVAQNLRACMAQKS